MSALVSTIKPHVNQINAPDELRKLQGWLIWRYETRAGSPKPLKVPYYAGGGKRHGVQGRPEDREQLVTFEAARAAAARKGFDGIGLALMPEWGITALDFDRCIVNGTLMAEVAHLVAGTYAEYSPSGFGIRAFVRGNLGNRKDTRQDTYGFETFHSKGFVTFTGNVLETCSMLGDDNTIADVPEPVYALCAARFNQRDSGDARLVESSSTPLGLSTDQMRDALAVLDPGMPYSNWLQIGMAIHHESQGDDFHLWDEWSSHSPNYPGSEQLEVHWRSFGINNAKNPVTARTLVKMANENGAHIDLSPVNPAAEFQAIQDTPAEAAAKAAAQEADRARFTPVPAHQFIASRSNARWLIRDVLPRAELVMLYGQSGTGKTFITIDLMMSIARGLDWRGRRTKQGRVVYIAAEGANGVKDRMDAYARHHHIDLATVPLAVIPDSPSFAKRGKDPKAVADAIGKADLIVVDTLSRVSGGVSMNNDEMNVVIDSCKDIAKATGATVLLVHHSGKDAEKGAMGWSGIRGAVDAEIEVLRDGNIHSISTTKQKDGVDNLSWGFVLHPVLIGLDEDDEEITSCVALENAELVTRDSDKPRIGKLETAIMAAVRGSKQPGEWGVAALQVVDEVTRTTGIPPYRIHRSIHQLVEKRILNLQGTAIQERV